MTQPQFYFFYFFISAVDTFILEKEAMVSGCWLQIRDWWAWGLGSDRHYTEWNNNEGLRLKIIKSNF